MADLVCHGVPSPALFQLQLRYIGEVRKSRVAAYEHRPKSRGWGHVERFFLVDDTVEQGTALANSWRELFYDNRMLRPSCYKCSFTSLERVSDVTIADFWGIEKSSHPELWDERGVSLLLANNAKGERLVRKMTGAGLIEAWPMTVADALPCNPMLGRPSAYVGDKDEPWQVLYSEGYGAMMRKMGYRKSEAEVLARRVVGKAKRVVKRLLGKG